ncbi:MAG: UbiA family prenyltransferase [Myxococcales bacterium]|nr:UbiA family prenyltransferase [Myxococcales bacterium]
MRRTLRHWLEVSRPGLWFPTIWLYALPLAGRHLLDSPRFWIGLAFVTFPLNFVLYGWNDIADADIDRHNPRKGNLLFGARATDAELARLPRALVAVGLLAALPLVLLDGPRMAALLAAIAAVLWLYNRRPHGLRSHPPLELCCQFGYLLVVPLSAWLNALPLPPAPTAAYLALFAIQSHLMGEVMDIDPDRATGRRTTATVIGARNTKLVIIGVVAAEVAMLFFVFGDPWFGGALALFLAWLVLDVAVLFRGRAYTLAQMKLFAVLTNLVAVASMLYVWWSGCLLHLPP